MEPTISSNQGKSRGQKVRKIKKIKKRTKPKESNIKETISSDGISSEGISKENVQKENSKVNKRSKGQALKFDMSDLNKGIKLLDLSEEDLDRGMEIITRTKKYMSKDERNILIKLESVLDLAKGIKKLNDINILSEKEESDFFRSMEEEDKKNMMIKEILEVFPEKKKQSVEKALEMKKKIDLLAELFLPEAEDGSGFSLSSLADLSNLGSINNLKLLSGLLRGLEGNSDDDEIEEDEYVEEENENDYEEIEDEADYKNDYVEVNKTNSNNKKHSKSKVKRNPNRRRKTSSKK